MRMCEIEENDAGGTTVWLGRYDSLDDVPESHQKLITAPIRNAFPEPEKFLKKAARYAPVPAMKKYLNALLERNSWILNLHQGVPEEWTSAGYSWYSETVPCAEIGPPREDPAKFPSKTLQNYYRRIDYIDWMGFAYAGGLAGAGQHGRLTNFDYRYHGDPCDPENTFVFGWSFCGDMLVYTGDDRGGWLWHENGQIHFIGSVADTLEWVFSELLAYRRPELFLG